MVLGEADLFRAQLFLDDTWVERSANVHRVWHAARKYPGPVLKADRPWEYLSFHPCAYGTVLHHEGRFRMWYMASGYVGYAESGDGVHWEKPSVGLHEAAGNRDNNIVLEQAYIDNISVIDDPEDGDWPLKALYWSSRAEADKGGIGAARSRDGIHWEKLGCVLNFGDRFNAVSVRHQGKYIVLGRDPDVSRRAGKGRVAAYTESADLIHWSTPSLALEPDLEDPLYMQFYSATAFPYEGLMVGSIERMHMCPDKLDTEIVWSRDGGRTWARSHPRGRFIEWGPADSWDSTWINLTSNGPIVKGNRLLFFYSARSGAHSWLDPQYQAAIGVATLRIDGFCSLHSSAKRGEILTRPMAWPEGDLLLNCDARHDIQSHPSNAISGEIWVEARDEADAPLPGFALADFPPTRSNTANRPGSYEIIRWNQGRSLRELAGRRLRLSIMLRDAHLYGFKAGQPSA